MRAEARAIAEAYLRDSGAGSGRINKVLAWGEITAQRPRPCSEEALLASWVVYLRSESLVLQSSVIVAVDRDTGGVVYYGSANDER